MKKVLEEEEGVWCGLRGECGRWTRRETSTMRLRKKQTGIYCVLSTKHCAVQWLHNTCAVTSQLLYNDLTTPMQWPHNSLLWKVIRKACREHIKCPCVICSQPSVVSKSDDIRLCCEPTTCSCTVSWQHYTHVTLQHATLPKAQDNVVLTHHFLRMSYLFFHKFTTQLFGGTHSTTLLCRRLTVHCCVLSSKHTTLS